jgi:uncharacterized protein (UPF0276 family)
MSINLSLSVNNLADFSIYETASQPIRTKNKLPFVEILWDNWCHLQADKLPEILASFSEKIAFHVMWSRFLERDEDDFKAFLKILKYHVDEIKPLYISDHICRFTLGKIHSHHGFDFDYQDLETAVKRVDYYQDYLGRQLLLENFASMTPAGCRQIEFFAKLVKSTGCGVFFDISNARVAHNNGYGNLEDWASFLNNLKELHCHVGGYRYDAEFNCYWDNHADNLSEDTLNDLKNFSSHLDIKTICYEREHKKNPEMMAQDLSLIQQTISM